MAHSVELEFLLSNPEVAFEFAASPEKYHLLQPHDQNTQVLALVLNNRTLAEHIIEHHDDWILTPAAQRLDVASIKASESGRPLAHKLARYGDWYSTSAAQNLAILSIKDSDGDTAAHILGRLHPDWAKTAAAQNYDVLALLNDESESVASVLATNKDKAWGLTAAAQDKRVLELPYGETYFAAHALARYNPKWHKTAAAQDLAVLDLRHNNGKSVAWSIVSVSTLERDSWIYTTGIRNKEIAEIISSFENGLLIYNEPIIFALVRKICASKDFFDVELPEDWLSIKSGKGTTLASEIASRDKTWFNREELARTKRILNLRNDNGDSVLVNLLWHNPSIAKHVAYAAIAQGLAVPFISASGKNLLVDIVTENSCFAGDLFQEVIELSNSMQNTPAYPQVMICLLATMYNMRVAHASEALTGVINSVEHRLHQYYIENPSHRKNVIMDESNGCTTAHEFFNRLDNQEVLESMASSINADVAPPDPCAAQKHIY